MVFFNAMAKNNSNLGGYREGSGRKAKYQDCDGNPLPTKPARIPEILTEKDIQDALIRKLKKDKEGN